MDKIIQESLEQYNFRNPQLEFIRHNENITYKLLDEGKTYEMRIHKPIEGFSLKVYQKESNSLKYIESEMLIVEHVGKYMDFAMQKPIRNKHGMFVSVLSDQTPVTVLEWIQGKTIENIIISEEIGETIGSMIAKLHRNFSKLDIEYNNKIYSKVLNHEIKRYMYNQQLISDIEAELSHILKKGQIGVREVTTMKDTLRIIKKRMDELETMQGMTGIIHADLSMSNLIFADKQVAPIDFSLSGYGYYYMDIGMILSQFNDINIRKSIKSGYEKIMQKEVPLCYIEPFFALGVLLFIVCQHDKIYMKEWFNGAVERWCKTIFKPVINNNNFVLG